MIPKTIWAEGRVVGALRKLYGYPGIFRRPEIYPRLVDDNLGTQRIVGAHETVTERCVENGNIKLCINPIAYIKKHVVGICI